MFSLFVGDGSGQCWVQAFGDVGQSILGTVFGNVGISAKELVEWKGEDKEWESHPAVTAALNKKFVVNVKKKEDYKGGYKFVVERVLSVGVSEQNTAFLQRLELYYSYLLD